MRRKIGRETLKILQFKSVVKEEKILNCFMNVITYNNLFIYIERYRRTLKRK